ncbi:hypothetical protein CCR85_00645 [Rhodothalassium salexigens]|uniref:TVP38/TMEM64 family protein n=1 Tax=Rhodothalassium salexigens TaxID=1086 RepID=UPI001911D89E|nr:VTT domain-containing protein [Rhodothalassium salexigens]MBK5910002.1 hypothetical protein [Rhodothalassium salexigens]
MTDDPRSADAATAIQRPLWRRLLPLALVAAGLAAVFVTGLDAYIRLDTLKTYRADLADVAHNHFWLAFPTLVVLYAALVAVSFPGASLMTIFAGFMFGTGLGGLGALIGATLGATAIFLAARTSLGEPLRQRAGPWLDRFQRGFAEGELSYLFVLRLVPAFPFWLVNIAPAFLGVRTRNYLISTALGIAPGTFVYASVGAGAGAVIDRGEDLKLGGLFADPAIWGPMAALVALALLPVAWKRWRGSPAPAPVGTADGD